MSANARLTLLEPEQSQDEPRADEPVLDDVDGRLPAAIGAAVVLLLGAAAGLAGALWLGAHQCVRIGGCG